MPIPETGGNVHVESAIAKLAEAMSGLTKVVDSLRQEVAGISAVSVELSVRCDQLGKTSEALNRYLFTGNGQPSITQQLTTVNTQLRTVVDTLKHKVSDHRLRTTEQLLRTEVMVISKSLDEFKQSISKSIDDLRTEHKEVVKDIEEDSEKREISKAQYLVAIIGFFGSVSAVILQILWSLFKK